MTRTAFGGTERAEDLGERPHALLALGRQDVEPDGLTPPAGMTIRGASSDHLVLDAGDCPVAVGDEVRFQPDYRSLLRAMTSPFVAKDTTRSAAITPPSRCPAPAGS
jgi:predicted amino acid racemase